MRPDVEHYRAYGLTIESEIQLPELPTINGADVGAPDVTIRLTTLEQLRESIDEDESDVHGISFESLGTFIVVDGERIYFEPTVDDATSRKFFRRTIENQVMAVLLLQRGELVVHGSAVAIDDRAVVFLGPRTAGKSTTAAAFHAAGYPVLADDIVGVRITDDGPVVLPGVPQLRLTPDTVEALGITDAVDPEGDQGPEKRYRQLSGVESPLPLECCYVLRDSDSLHTESVPGGEQFISFIEHVYSEGFLSDDNMDARGFKQCATVLESVPLRRLHRPKEYAVLDSVVDAIVDETQSRVTS